MIDFAPRQHETPCKGCHCGLDSDTADTRSRAATLPQSLDWRFLEAITDPTLDDEERTTRITEANAFLITWYDETKDICVFKYLEGVMNVVVIIGLADHVFSGRESVLAWIDAETARYNQSLTWASSESPLGNKKYNKLQFLTHALRYWIQAAVAYDAIQLDKSTSCITSDSRDQMWAKVCYGSLIQAVLFLGMAHTPKLASEMNAASGRKRTEHLRDFAVELARLLRQLAEKQNGKKCATLPEVIDLIRKDLADFHNKQIANLRPDRPRILELDDIDTYVTKICNRNHPFYEIIAPALKAVYEPHRGRPRRNGPSSPPAATRNS